MTAAALDRATSTLLAADLPPDALGAAALTFLLRRYIATGDERLRGHIESGLAAALDAVCAEPDPIGRCEWLDMLLYADGLSEDERVGAAIRASIPSIVDDLERQVRRDYEPGDGLAGADTRAHARSGSALLSAFAVTGRLPYAMLAEELLVFLRRTWWSEDHGAFGDDLIANCCAARLCCQIALLHADPDYASAAVLAPGADYAADAARALACSSAAADAGRAAGYFGLAMLDWFALANNLQ